MAVKYVVREKGRPADPEAPKKWYAMAKSSGEISFKQLSREISEGSTTVSDTDVMAVLNDLSKLLSRHLAAGEIVRFGDFGSFQVSVQSNGSDTEKEFHSGLIKKAKINFRPGERLRDMLKTVRFEKYKG
ncbi:MAG: DNA-binding protein [Bacteroidia bacterium]|nr:MAG: DNA-binding protein [Bacteroidia bacterium]